MSSLKFSYELFLVNSGGYILFYEAWDVIITHPYTQHFLTSLWPQVGPVFIFCWQRCVKNIILEDELSLQLVYSLNIDLINHSVTRPQNFSFLLIIVSYFYDSSFLMNITWCVLTNTDLDAQLPFLFDLFSNVLLERFLKWRKWRLENLFKLISRV